MAKKAGYTIENTYQGGYSAFEPLPMGTGNYPITTGSLGIATDPRTANILQEVSTKLSSGVKHIELEGVSAEILDSIPKQQFEEVHRLSKLTGVDVTMHGPVIDTTGIDPRRGGFSESERELAERKILQTLERSHELNPNGNIPVNFHSAEGLPGSEFAAKRGEKGERVYNKIIAVNKETGRLAPLETETKFYPGEGKEGLPGKEKYSPIRNLSILNNSEWDNSLSQLFFNKERADELLEKNRIFIEEQEKKILQGAYPKEALPKVQEKIYDKMKDVQLYLDDIHKQANALFSKAYKYGTEDQKRELDDLSKKYYGEAGIEEAKRLGYRNSFKESQATHNLLLSLQDPRLGLAPQINVPVEQFAVEQSAKTYGNAAFQAYKQYKDKAPILTIENPPAGFALSTGEDIKNLVDKSRKQFIENAVKSRDNGGLGLSENEAKKTAEKFIGATLDVGHMNMLRKYGYSEQDIIQESAKLAPVLKHVHLSDNFGFEHTELPMGMGNVPIKEIMQKLGKKGFEARKIIEAGQWWQHFKTSPFQATLENFGSPIYSGGVAPYWNQNIGLQQNYMSGYGMMLPQINYETFGAGFSQLPAELGGQRLGAQGSRMSGRPME